MKECFLILSYCDTEEKIGILNETLEKLKPYNLPICLHSNYAIDKIPPVDYFLMDKTNPICKMGDRTIMFWERISFDNQTFDLALHKKDYGYTACHQLKSGLLFLHELGFTDVHIINYDSRFEDSIFNTAHEKLEDGFDSVLYRWNEDRNNQLCLCFFSLKLENLIETLKNITYSNYVGVKNGLFVEEYLFSLFGREAGFKSYYEVVGDKVYDIKDFDDNHDHFKDFEFDGVSVYVGKEKYDEAETGKMGVLISSDYDINVDVVLSVRNGKNVRIHCEKNTYYRTKVNIEDLISFSVNGKIKEIIDEFERHASIKVIK